MNLLPSLLPHGSMLAASAASAVAALGIGLAVFVLVLIAIVVLLIVSEWKVYKKAGKPGWAVLVPFYCNVVRLEIVGKPLWWVVLLFIPVVNIVLFIIITRRLAAVFGKGVWFTVGLIFLPFIFYPILAFGNAQYMNTFPPAAPMSEAVKWSLIALLAFMVMEMPLISSFEQGLTSQEPLKVLMDTDTGYPSGYAIDGNHVYYNDAEVVGADPESFTLIGGYGADDKAVYYGENRLPDADRDTFVSLSRDYDIAKDANHVFVDDVMSPDADPATFEILANGYAKDASHVYYAGPDGLVVLEDADLATFTTDVSSTAPYDAKDKIGGYLYGDRVDAKQGADSRE